MEIMIKMKGMEVRVKGKDEVIIKLNKYGIGNVNEEDIKKEGDVEIVKKKKVIWKMKDEKEYIRMSIKVKRGSGYVKDYKRIN